MAENSQAGVQKEIEILRNQMKEVTTQRDGLADEVQMLKAPLKVLLQRVTSLEEKKRSED